MRVTNELDCDTCFTSHKDTPIIEKPSRFGHKGIIRLEALNVDDRPVDNICLDCLKDEIDLAMVGRH